MSVECCICTEEIENVVAVKTKCNHLYHEECLLEWLAKADTCPSCRVNIEKTSLAKIRIPLKIAKTIDEATSYHNTTEKWDSIVDICDEISEKPENAKDYIGLILKRIDDKNPLVAGQAITLLDACIKNCGRKFQLEIASKEFEAEFQRLVSKATTTIQKKMCVSLKSWAENEFKAGSGLTLIPSLYRKLKSNGYDFEDTPQERNDVAKAIKISPSSEAPSTSTYSVRSLRSSSSIPNLDSIQQHADVTIGNAKPNQPQGRQSKFVVCEICDEQIKNSNQLRIHMESMHEIKISSAKIYGRPSKNCEKCRCRFFSDEGLERHLLTMHTPKRNLMPTVVSKGKHAGRKHQ